MIFYNSHYLFLLFVIPIAIVIIIIGHQIRKKRLSRLIQVNLWKTVIPTLSYTRRFWKHVFFIIAFSLIIISFLRPQYGLRIETKSRKGQDIFIALDTSASMFVTDARPYRFKRAKQEIKGLIESLKGDRVGLIAFSGTAFIQCPLTTDYSALHMFLDDIKIGSIPTPGTDIATAIKTARLAFNRQSQSKKKLLIIISDGESFENNPIESAKKAAEDGLTIFTIGIGTPGGEPIPIYNAAGNRIGLKKDKTGQVIISQLNELLLQEIAQLTDGHYFLSNTGPLAINSIYRIISELEKTTLSKEKRQYRQDRYYWFLIPALFFLIMEFIFSEKKSISQKEKDSA